MSAPPPRLAKLFSALQRDRYVSFGWTVKHEIRERPEDAPYEYILEWMRAGRPVRPQHWAESWIGVANDTDRAAKLNAELEREVGPDHSLSRHRTHPIACCTACDDVLFQSEADGAYFVVHLTWRGAREPAPWPETREVRTDAELAELGAAGDHA